MDHNELQDESLTQDFLVESLDLVGRLDQDLVLLEATPTNPELLQRIFRAVHTIKGTSSFLGFVAIVELTHRTEDLLNDLRSGRGTAGPRVIDELLRVVDYLRSMIEDVRAKRSREYDLGPLLSALQALRDGGEPATGGPDNGAAVRQPAAIPAETSGPSALFAPEDSPGSMRVDAIKLEHLINMVGELALERNRLLQISRISVTGKASPAELAQRLSDSTARLSFITDELQAASLKTRMLPINTLFRRLPRIVRDLAVQLGKEVDLQVRGGDTELDRMMVEQLADPLIHLVRNAMDHGIETPDQRTRASKKPSGLLRVEARAERDHVVVEVADDGAGMDAERIGQKAVATGLISQELLRTMSPQAIFELIFLPGFSTRDTASNISGRGVGMDVVQASLKKIDGAVELDSQPGRGTRVILKLPLTMVIFPVLFVKLGNEIYGLPMRTVVETLRVLPEQIHTVDGHPVLHLHARTLPVIRLAQLLSVPARQMDRRQGKAVIAGVASRKVALLVDGLVGEEATVIKPLGGFLGRCPGVAGATLGGDGTVRLLLDVAALVAMVEARPHAPPGTAYVQQ